MSEAPPQVAPGSPEELGNAMSQLLLAPSTTSLLDLPTHMISSVVDILLLSDRSEGYRQKDIASFRLTCSLFNSLVLARATRMVLIYPTQLKDFLSLPVRLLPNLQLLDLNQCKISSLSLVGMPTTIRSVNLQETTIADLRPLSACEGLEVINCSNTEVSDLSPLSTCLKLRDVNCRWTHVFDLSPLSACLELCKVDCIGTSVKDIACLAACPQLRSIACGDDVIGLQFVDTLEFEEFESEEFELLFEFDDPWEYYFYLFSHWALPEVTITNMRCLR